MFIRAVFTVCMFYLHDTATTEIYTYLHTLSLHDALPILSCRGRSQAPSSRSPNLPRALITGITGQDGLYLGEFLAAKGYEVFGLVRGQSNPKVSIEIGRAHV